MRFTFATDGESGESDEAHSRPSRFAHSLHPLSAIPYRNGLEIPGASDEEGVTRPRFMPHALGRGRESRQAVLEGGADGLYHG